MELYKIVRFLLGYISEDCSVQKGVAPTVMTIQNSPCDITQSACFRTSIMQTGAVSEGLFCRIKVGI